MHEIDRRLGEHLTDQAHLANRGAVEVIHAPGVHRTEDDRLGIALYRIHHLAREGLDKLTGRRGDGSWTFRQCTGSSGRSIATRSLTVGSTSEAVANRPCRGDTAIRGRSRVILARSSQAHSG